jgi:Flp pilus assembly protein TadG
MLLNRLHRRRRSGAIIVWAAVLIPVLIGMVAFAVDVGYMCLARNHLQVAADAGAMGGVGRLSKGQPEARAKAEEIAEAHFAGATGDTISVASADIVLGGWTQSNRTFTPTTNGPNAVKVTTRKTINLFFGRIFGMGTMTLEATAIAAKSPRDIAFVIDLSGSMNNDSEIWATGPINSAFPDYPGIGTSLMQDVFTDFGYGTYPGTVRNVGQVTTTGTDVPTAIPSGQYTINGQGETPVYHYLTTTYLMNNNNVASKYRIASSDSAATRKTKAYRWLMDKQLAPLMPAARPIPNSDTNYEYWANYLDYVFRETSSTPINNQASRQITSGSNPYPDAWPDLTASTINPYRNKVGYQTYVQFMMDFGWDTNVGSSGRRTPLSRLSADCPLRLDNDPASPGYGLLFPPREQPTHAARMAVMAGIKKVADLNANVAVESRDHVCVITFETASGTNVRYPLNKDSCDYNAAKASARDMQAASDWANSTASENGLILAKNHLNPALNPAGARTYSKRVLIFLSDGIPNIKQSSDDTINTFMSENDDGEWFGNVTNGMNRNAALMQIQQIQAMGWRTHSIGLGLGADKTLMDRMARMAGTAVKDPANPTGPKISPYASGNPADYQTRLTAIFDEIASTPAIQLVK